MGSPVMMYCANCGCEVAVSASCKTAEIEGDIIHDSRTGEWVFDRRNTLIHADADFFCCECGHQIAADSINHSSIIHNVG